MAAKSAGVRCFAVFLCRLLVVGGRIGRRTARRFALPPARRGTGQPDDRFGSGILAGRPVYAAAYAADGRCAESGGRPAQCPRRHPARIGGSGIAALHRTPFPSAQSVPVYLYQRFLLRRRRHDGHRRGNYRPALAKHRLCRRGFMAAGFPRFLPHQLGRSLPDRHVYRHFRRPQTPVPADFRRRFLLEPSKHHWPSES